MEISANFTALLPSLIAIGFALLTRQTLLAMFMGIWFGAWLVEGSSLFGLVTSLIQTIDTYIMQAIVPQDGNSDHFAIVVFSILTGAMVGVISHNGGMSGLVQWLQRIAKGRRSGQAVTASLGGIIFFDDYCSALVVGNTMRPLTDGLRISRAKLAFLVDSTAAPISCIAIVSTWIGVQASLLQTSLNSISLEANSFDLIISALKYNYYVWFLLFFIIIMIWRDRDFGSMLKAERRALKEHKDNEALFSLMSVAPATHHDLFKPEVKPRISNALIPLFIYVAGSIWGLFQTGYGEDFRSIIGSSDPFRAILWGSLFSLISAILISLISSKQKISQIIDAMEYGARPMLSAVIILTFSWAIAGVNSDLHTAEYIISNISNKITPEFLPTIIFILAAITSFATGSSWSTMAILMPLSVPLTFNILTQYNIDEIASNPIFLGSIASILTGALWGDHCSPISNTTILSSIASNCPHAIHVNTQLPYALSVAGISVICGLLPLGFGMGWWQGLIFGAITIIALFQFYGKKVG
jgi:Na+/H+ antiporter NhaC